MVAQTVQGGEIGTLFSASLSANPPPGARASSLKMHAANLAARLVIETFGE